MITRELLQFHLDKKRWFPKVIRAKIIKNYIPEKLNSTKCIKLLRKENIINDTMSWSFTPEGMIFWQTLSNKYRGVK